MARFVYLQNTVGTPAHIAKPPSGHAITVIDQYAFQPEDLTSAQGLLLSQHLDEIHLADHRTSLTAFLDRGGVIALNGPVARPYLDPPGAYRPVAARGARDWILELADPHPIIHGVCADDLTSRRGVIGFWARGSFDAPEDALVLTRFARSGRPADWLWRRPQGGAILVHPGNDIWGYAGDDTSARPIFSQFLNWVAAP